MNCPYMMEFKDQIKLENGRYIVKLPLKENHPEIPNNYTLCHGRLKKKLKQRLDKKFKTSLR